MSEKERDLKATTYTVVTSRGYWGRADSLRKAAENANIGTDFVRADVYATPNRLFKETYINDFGGFGCHFDDDFFDKFCDVDGNCDEEGNAFSHAVFTACCWGTFSMKRTARGKLIMEQEADDE